MAHTKSSNSELYGIQMLRAVAALAVVIHHTLEHSNGALYRFSPDWLTTSGACGVDIFFIISGFIMLHVSFRAGRTAPTAGDFLFRRITRIYPFYWLCCLGILILSGMGFLVSHRYGVSAILASLLLVPLSGEKLIGVSWTLVYEVYFYLLFAATLWIRTAWFSLIGTTGAVILFYFAAPLMPVRAIADFLSNPLPIEFCLGLGLAYIYSAKLSRGRDWRPMPVVAILGSILMIIAPYFVSHDNTAGLPPFPRIVVWGLPAVLVVAGFIGFKAPKSAIMRLWVLLGDASYALYLTHVFVMIAYGRVLKIPVFHRFPQFPLTLIVIAIAVVVALATHLLIEKPLLRLIRRLTHRQPSNVNEAMPARPDTA